MDHSIYARAESFLPWNLQSDILNSTIFPYWTEKNLYYFQQSDHDSTLISICTKTGIKSNIMSMSTLLISLSNEINEEVNFTELFYDKFKIYDKPLRLYFTFRDKDWVYIIKQNILTANATLKVQLKSPNKKWSLYTDNYNLYLININTNNIDQLTIDGIQYYDYASSPETNTKAITERLNNIISPPIALWSPDSTKIVTHKLNQQNIKSLTLLQNVPDNDQRPIAHSYRMSFSGDECIPKVELVIIDILSKNVIPLKIDSLLSPYLSPLELGWVWWSKDSKNVYYLRESRGASNLSLCMAELENGIEKTLISESSDTYIEPSQNFLWSSQVIVLEETQQIIWLSQRSGYAHIYLYQIENQLLNIPITQGEWTVRQIHFYDRHSNWLYFTGCGFYKDIDPYYKQLFRCQLDGSKLECLTKEVAYHSIQISPYQNSFIDTYSEIDKPPISILKALNGTIISSLEIANIDALLKNNWKPPKRFCVLARDNQTPIFGNLYFPSSFDKHKKYPVIDHIYPGPQLYRTPANFCIYEALFRSAWTAQALAELGFIVLHIDGFGTPGRSKSFHDMTYKKMGDCSIPDHVSALQQLANKYNFIDMDNVGITGYSGGGYAAARAMLMYPDFYKVGVAGAGNHDLRCYPANYGEKYNSLDLSTYPDQSSASYAKNLKGKLLLIHGEMDDNVHPCATLQLVDALIKYNKDFDMLIMPNQNHKSTFDHPYYIRKCWDYFVVNLLKDIPPTNYKIKPVPRDFPQSYNW